MLNADAVPLNGYVGRGTNGLEKLWEEIQAENAGVTIPMAARWLGRVPQLKEKDGPAEVLQSHRWSLQCGRIHSP
jgi:hypothetical protein